MEELVTVTIVKVVMDSIEKEKKNDLHLIKKLIG